MLEFKNRDSSERGVILAWESGPAFTFKVENEVFGCFGIVIPWQGMGMAWMDLSATASCYPVWLTRTTKRIVEDAMRAYDLRRMETVVLADNDVNLKWIQTIGFKAEYSTAHKYTPDGRDVVRFELVK